MRGRSRGRVLSLNKLGTVTTNHYLLLAASILVAKQAQKGPSRASGSESPYRLRFQRVAGGEEAEKVCIKKVHLVELLWPSSWRAAGEST
jgi:hypothetical protein